MRAISVEWLSIQTMERTKRSTPRHLLGAGFQHVDWVVSRAGRYLPPAELAGDQTKLPNSPFPTAQPVVCAVVVRALRSLAVSTQ